MHRIKKKNSKNRREQHNHTKKMKRINLLLLFFIALWQLPIASQTNIKAVSGIYAGGHIRRGRPQTITKLRKSGFTYILLFNVHVDTDGTLMTDGETICKNGEYVFHQTQPFYQQDIKDLKTAPTSIQRIEIVIGGHGLHAAEAFPDCLFLHG